MVVAKGGLSGASLMCGKTLWRLQREPGCQ